MNISAKTEYACVAMLELKAAGLVASTRGAAGGYRLACPPAEVSLGQVMDVIGGSTSATRVPSASPESPAVKVLMRAWQDVADEVGEMLGRITFDELVDRMKKKRGRRDG